MAVPPSIPFRHPPPPFSVPTNGTIDERFAAVATELNRKAYSGLAGPAYRFIGLISPNGSTYRLFVDDVGALKTELVARS